MPRFGPRNGCGLSKGSLRPAPCRWISPAKGVVIGQVDRDGGCHDIGLLHPCCCVRGEQWTGALMVDSPAAIPQARTLVTSLSPWRRGG
jgi:hypothetical protein